MVRKKLVVKITAFLAALSLIFSVLPVSGSVTEVKADKPQNTDWLTVSTSEWTNGDVIWAAKLWQEYKDNTASPSSISWDDRYAAVEAYMKSNNLMKDDGSTIDENINWDHVNNVPFNKITVDSPYNDVQCFKTTDLVVTSGGAITINSDHYAPIEVSGTATVEGRIVIESSNKDTFLTINSGATLELRSGASIQTDNRGKIHVKKGGKVLKDGTAFSVTIDEKNVTFNGDQDDDYDLFCKNGTGSPVWSGRRGPHVTDSVVLPYDEDSYIITRDYYYEEVDENNDGKKDHADYDPKDGHELPPGFASVRIDVNYTITDALRIDKLYVTPGTTLTLEAGSMTYDALDQNGDKILNGEGEYKQRTDSWSAELSVKEAEIAGPVVLQDSHVKGFEYDENQDPTGREWDHINSLYIKNKLSMIQTGLFRKYGNAVLVFEADGPAEIKVYNMSQLQEFDWIDLPKGSKISDNDGNHVIGGVTFDGSQTKNYRIRYDKAESKWKIICASMDVTLPEEAEIFEYTIDQYWKNPDLALDENGEPETWEDEFGEEQPVKLDPWFDSITVKSDGKINKWAFDQCLRIGTLKVESEMALAITTGGDENSGDKWNGRIEAKNAEIAGTVSILNSPLKNDKNEDEPNLLRVFENLKITGNGKISAVGNGEFWIGDWDASIPKLIDIPKTSAITTEKPFHVDQSTKILVNKEVYTIPTVYSGNPGDEGTTHANFKFDETRMNDNGAWFKPQEDGSWALKELDEEGNLIDFYVWWGAPFAGEYRVYFDEGGAKLTGGSTFTTGTFHNYTKGTPIEFELVPPEGFTGTPIVFVNGGSYNIGKDYMRSDDFLASDLWWDGTVTRLEVVNNKVTYVPKDADGIGFYVYYDPEEIMDDAMFFIDRRYLWSGAYDEDGNWFYLNVSGSYGIDDDWAAPGNEFMVEATRTNSYGTIEMTPGIDCYRVGNKVKALYQGFELLNGGVDVKFTPASGYDLLAVNIDGKEYAPTAVSGMTYKNGTYTLKITTTPEKNSTIKGLYPKDYRKDNFVKLKSIVATFGIRSYSGGGSGDSGSSSGGSGTSTDDTPSISDGGNGSSSDTETEPEIKKQTTTTDKADDGTQTTTTSTTYTDGSKVTEKVVEKPDGSSTSTTTTTEADGTKIVEKVEEKADGSSKATTTTTETDGTKKTETVEKKKDGTEVTTNTVKDADGNSTTEKVEKKKDGTVTTTNTTKDADGASTTEKVVEKPDGSVTTTSTEKDADGNVLSTSKVVEKTKEDGTKTITATEKNADGSSSTSKTTISTDGSSKTNTTTQNADGSTTKEKITEKADGSLTRTATTTDEDGNVLATEKEKVTISKSGTETSTTTVENADGSSSENVVKTKADGTATSTLTETDASGNVSVTIGSTKKDGSGISKSYAVEDDGVVLTAVEATTTSASIPASVKVNGKTVPVTSVGENAMKDNETVKTVKLADSITSIGEGAFSGASNLKTIKLSANITEIAPGAFEGIKSNATFYITATSDKEFDALVELLKKSGVGSKVKFKRA